MAVIDITPWDVTDEARMCAIYLEFRANGWRGSVQAFEVPGSDEFLPKLQLDKGDRHIEAGVGDVIVPIGSTFVTMPKADFG
jgi:hypothetical protein